jgi:hypothetical protein
VALSVSRNRHGANPPDGNVGGDPNLSFRGGVDSETVYFLDGILEQRSSLGLQMSYELLRQLFIEVRAQRFWQRNIEVQSATRRPLNFGRIRFGVYWNR